MSGEHFPDSAPEPNELDTVEIGGRSLRSWHEFLTHDQTTGEPTGHLEVPCSRYGRTGADTAWWAIAAECVMVEANGEPDAPEESMDFLMGLAVNDHEDVGHMVIEWWHCVPEALKEYLDVESLQ